MSEVTIFQNKAVSVNGDSDLSDLAKSFLTTQHKVVGFKPVPMEPSRKLLTVSRWVVVFEGNLTL